MWIRAMRLQRTDHSNGELIRRFNAEIIFTTNALVTSRNHGVRNLSCTQFKCIVQEVKIAENGSHLRGFNADSWQKSSVALKTNPYTMHVENTMPIDAKIIKSKSRFPPSHAGQHTISPIKFKLICKKNLLPLFISQDPSPEEYTLESENFNSQNMFSSHSSTPLQSREPFPLLTDI